MCTNPGNRVHAAGRTPSQVRFSQVGFHGVQKFRRARALDFGGAKQFTGAHQHVPWSMPSQSIANGVYCPILNRRLTNTPKEWGGSGSNRRRPDYEFHPRRLTGISIILVSFAAWF